MLEQYEVPLTRFSARLLGDEDAARDVVQHAFLRLCNRSPDELDGRVAQWLFTVCRNKVIDVIRVRRRAESLEQTAIPDRIGREPDPSVAAERRELYHRVSRLIDELPTNQREAIGLWSEGFSYREIAEIIDRGEGNVRVLVHRALKRLRGHPAVRELTDRPAAANRVPERQPTKFV